MSNPGAEAGDRRRVCRYPVIFQDASLGWWLESDFMSTPVRLVNLSLSGCLIEAHRRTALAKQQAVWVQANTVSVTGWTEGRIVSIKKTWSGKCLVGIAFLGTFPYEPFKKLIYGREICIDSSQENSPEHERDHFWK